MRQLKCDPKTKGFWIIFSRYILKNILWTQAETPYPLNQTIFMDIYPSVIQ